MMMQNGVWKMPDHIREDVFRLHKRGVSISEIAEILGLNKQTVLYVLRPGYWQQQHCK